MTTETDRLDNPILQDESTDDQKALQEKLNRIANKAAKRAVNRQQRNDAKQTIISK